MIIAPTEHNASYESSDPGELLIKEARQKARRRRLTAGVVLLVALLVVVVLLVVVGVGRTGPKKTATGDLGGTVTSSAPRCSLRQLSVNSGGQFGAGGTDGGILLFRNISSHACSLTGYPNVIAIGKTAGSTIEASHVTDGYLGGLTGVSAAPKPPTVVLANKRDVASDWYQYSENGPAGYTLFHASTLSVGLSGSKSVVHVSGLVDAADGKMWVTPFVPGKTGNAK